MSSPLSSLPIHKRMRSAALFGLFAALFTAVGILPWTGPTPLALKVFSVVTLVIAVLLALSAWGLVKSVRLDKAEMAIDAAIAETGALKCDCGQEHDPDEMHVVDACERGTSCDHSCAGCVLAESRKP